MANLLRSLTAIDKPVAECPPEMGQDMGQDMAPPMAPDMGQDAGGASINIKLDDPTQMAQVLKALQMIQGGAQEDAPVEDEAVTEYENEPEEHYDDHDHMLNKLSGGINRKKDAFAAAQPGDNAMAVETIKSSLKAALAEKKNKKSTCKECGKPSYTSLDEEKQKGVDGKVCWKGYKRMGTKKKGGKTVDNCVKM